MAQDTLVGQEIDDGQRILAHLDAAHIDVSAGAWIRTEDSRRWEFYVVSKAFEEMEHLEAYKKIHAELRRLPDLWIDTLNVRLIGATEPLAKDLIAYQSTHPKRVPVRFRGRRLGALEVEEAFIYPPPAFLAAQAAPAAKADAP